MSSDIYTYAGTAPEGGPKSRGEKFDPVEKAKHYNVHPSGVECIEISAHLGFLIGNAFKYLWRAGEKLDRNEDLNKALWYIERASKTPSPRPSFSIRRKLRKLIYKVHRTEGDRIKAEGLLLLCEAACTRNREHHAIKLGVAAGCVQFLIER